MKRSIAQQTPPNNQTDLSNWMETYSKGLVLGAVLIDHAEFTNMEKAAQMLHRPNPL